MENSEFRKRISDLPNFKTWVAETKAAGPDGRPLVLYHGTGSKFENFRTAAFFTSDRWIAEGYADLRGGDEGHVKAVFVAMNNPAGEAEIRRAAREIGLDDEMTFALIDPLQNNGAPAKVIELLKNKGHDGAIFEEYDDSGELFKSYVPFESQQIVAADHRTMRAVEELHISKRSVFKI